MQYQTTRILARNTHILVALYQFAYIYGPLHDWHYGLAVEQWVMFPLLLISGLWLRKGQVVWHYFIHRQSRIMAAN